MDKKIVARPLEGEPAECLRTLHPILQRIYQARNISTENELNYSLAQLPSPALLSGMETMLDHLQAAIDERKKILIIADFDADGATSCVVAMLGLKMLGVEHVSYLVPNRFKFGYGLTPEIVDVAYQQQPDILLTVDNGIANLDGVQRARELGMTVLITDHHLPGEVLPDAQAIVNPCLSDDRFPSRALAGVGVMFYVLLALRARLRELGRFSDGQQPNLAQLLDLVALGTVADVVPLDHVNRILVYQGLQRIRSGRAHAGVMAIIEAAGKSHQAMVASGLGFAIGPRLNAAGRLDDMSLGIECLLSDSREAAKPMAIRLDELNRERREIEAQMKVEAMNLLQEMTPLKDKRLPVGVCLYEKDWHQGVIGILASRIKDRLHKPVIAFAGTGEGEIKGSARSIPGIHIRDVLCDIAAAHPGMIIRFGGHAMAAGLTLKLSDYPPFAMAFADAVARQMVGEDTMQTIWTDGELGADDLGLAFAEQLSQAGPWGQAFPEPVFEGVFEVFQARIVGQQHLKFIFKHTDSGYQIDGIAFFVDQPESWLGSRKLRIAYRLDINEFRDRRSAQLLVEHMERVG